jgi:hypothetical protein
MKRILTIVMVILFAGCSNYFLCDEPAHLKKLSDFQAATYKGKIVDFTKVSVGSVYLSEGSRKNLFTKNSDGSMKYLTGDVVDSFDSSTALKIGDGKGFCVRFEVPEIETGDYVILDAKIMLPKKISLNGTQIDSVTGSFRYTPKNSDELEYIWFVFEDSAKQFYLKGDWTINLYSSDILLLAYKFKAL